MFKANFTNEAVNIFQYIENNLVKKYPTNKIVIEYFFLSVLENEDSSAYQLLSKATLTSTLTSMQEWFVQVLSKTDAPKTIDKVEHDSIYDKAIESAAKEFNVTRLASAHVLMSILKLNENIAKQFKQIGITYEQLLTNLDAVLPSDAKIGKSKKNRMQQPQILKGPVEDLLINMNDLAANGKIDEVIGNDEAINTIFNILSKRDRNNVVVVGDSGIGKTATVAHIANLIINEKVPDAFKNKKLMKMDFMALVSGAALRGNFEAKFNAIVADAVKKDGYIFFVDDIQSILSESSKFGEVNTENMLDMILMERNIKFICTMDKKSYNTYILGRPSMKRRFQKVELKEKTDEEIIEIMKLCKVKYEKYHNVEFTDAAIETCVKLTKQYVKTANLPDYAIDIIDELGAKKGISKAEDPRITEYKKDLHDVTEKLKGLNSSSEKQYTNVYDKLKSREIELKSQIQLIEKDLMLNNKPILVDEDDVRELISVKTNIPVTKLNENERDKLKMLNSKLKSLVIGQEEAVDEVCRVVKRQRIGIANNNRPAVLFFSGTTGSGKTYLAKKLAEEVFGDEKSMVRLDMSEYSDKMTVSKLTGSSPGYIGYDKGGILTEAIKKNNHCVLLLDEMEKADDDVHNVFLQLFDEGRLTDNMGNIVDFSNVIVIMTSNVGAKEISNRGKGIGFVQNNDANNRDAINKAMKNKFRPEFINRIDSIIYFNKLTEENIKEVIKLEIGKFRNKVNSLNYVLGESFDADATINYIFDKVKEKSDYGARPVIHAIQHEFEDKITDYIIDKQPSEGFVFEVENIGLGNLEK